MSEFTVNAWFIIFLTLHFLWPGVTDEDEDMSAEIGTIPTLQLYLDSLWSSSRGSRDSDLNTTNAWVTAPCTTLYNPPAFCDVRMDPAQPSSTPDESSELGSEFQTQLDLFLKLGFSQTQVRAALLKLGLNADTNRILGELIQAAGESEEKEEPTASPVLVPRGDGSSKVQSSQNHSAPAVSSAPEELVEDEDALRPIVIDGSNVAMRWVYCTQDMAIIIYSKFKGNINVIKAVSNV